MPGIVYAGDEIQVPSLDIKNFIDNPTLALKAIEDKRGRATKWIRAIVIHTTKGIWPQKIIPGLGPDTNVEEKVAKYWSTSSKHAGAHCTVDWDASIGWHADILEVAMHAGLVNEVTLGIEIYQGADGRLFEYQLNAVVKLIDVLTQLLNIQRQICVEHYPLKRIRDGRNCVGVYGHRSILNCDRGRGDPGDAIFDMLKDAGYEAFRFAKNEDRKVWKERQVEICGMQDCDGIPGPSTVKALMSKGYEHGIFVQRPNWLTSGG